MLVDLSSSAAGKKTKGCRGPDLLSPLSPPTPSRRSPESPSPCSQVASL
ncbi:unnamed protein product [Spirodela intermedia]|uniref:Uncharacterized protein n=1 Tax=Spirodela intermedia TaxID=51605 RepID=A0A811G7H8_SPIIN|nr:unnamed protein product [Spirodela intermedia]